MTSLPAFVLKLNSSINLTSLDCSNVNIEKAIADCYCCCLRQRNSKISIVACASHCSSTKPIDCDAKDLTKLASFYSIGFYFCQICKNFATKHLI